MYTGDNLHILVGMDGICGCCFLLATACCKMTQASC